MNQGLVTYGFPLMFMYGEDKKKVESSLWRHILLGGVRKDGDVL